jgi:drug/metabolite transporter (DMT)-like permease
LRFIGAAREAAFFATAPFVGAVAAVPLLGDRLRTGDLVGGFLMAVGIALLMVLASTNRSPLAAAILVLAYVAAWLQAHDGC